MDNNSNTISLALLTVLCIILTILLNMILSKKNKKQMDIIFAVVFTLLIISLLSSVLQIFCVNVFNATPVYFDYFAYIGVCYLPVAFLFFALIFARTEIKFKRWYLLLFIIPTISLLVLWTNDFHHLFYEV